MSSLGIYFGPKIISVVQVKGKKIVNKIQVSQAAATSGELEEKVPLEMKAKAIVAMIKDDFKRNKISAKEATLCLSGRELIVRSFEMPVMPRNELQSAINFEVKKYIPFKVEDLIADFQIQYDKLTQINYVLFIGIKKENLDRYIAILKEIGIKVSGIEYSAYSLLRCLTLSNLSDKGIVAVLGVDLKGEDEANFSVLDNGFPLFSRDINLAEGQEDIEGINEFGEDKKLEKLKNEIRVSLDYYHRKFPSKDAKKIYFFCNPEYRSRIETLLMDIGLSVKFIESNKFIEAPLTYSLDLVKSFGASLSGTIKTNVKIDILAVKDKAGAGVKKEKSIKDEAAKLTRGLSIDLRFVFLGLFICLATFVFGMSRSLSVRSELEATVNTRPKVTTVKATQSLDELSKLSFANKKVNELFKKLVEGQVYLTVPIKSIPEALPEGVWLTNLSFNKEEKATVLTLEGVAYLGDSDKEFESINQFIANLKDKTDFPAYFKKINISSIDHKQTKELTLTRFSIYCSTD